MALLKKITAGNAGNQQVQKVISAMEKGVGAVPETIRMLGNSPGLFSQLMGQINYYASHPHLGQDLPVMIRYCAAVYYSNQVCIEFNGDLLKKRGMTDEDLAKIADNPESAPLDKKKRALLCFVVDGIKDQSSASLKKMQYLRDTGWSDADILDAAVHGFFMFAPGKLIELFQMV